MNQYEIFSSDPALLTYCAKYLQEPSCTIRKDEDRYELCSSDIDALESSASLGQDTDGLLSVLHLLSPSFKTLRTDEKVREGVNGLLFILNGIIKLKYKMPGLTRDLTTSPSQVRTGIVSKKDDQRQVVKTKSRVIPVRVHLTVGEEFLLAADRQSPTGVEMWYIARANAPFANALYYYANANQDDRTNLNNVVEQIKNTFRKGQFEKWAHKWIGQNKQEADSKMEALEQWLNNPYISGSKARHSPVEPRRIKADKLRATNSTIDSVEATKIIDTLLTKWIEEKHSGSSGIS